jgi:heme exporter protein C
MYGMSSSTATASKPLVELAKICLLLVQSALIVAGFLWLPPARGFANESLARIVVFHVPCSMVAYIASIVATWYAISYLRSRSPLDDIKSRTSFALALMFWVLTTVTGAIFSRVQWGAFWSWDIKQTSILMLLLICIAYFALRAAIDNPGRQAALAAAYAIFAMVAVPVLTYILPNSTPDTLHPKGVITTKEGLDSSYKLVLWLGVLSLTMVYVWAFRVQVRIEQMALKVGRKVGAFKVPAVTISEAG